MKLSTRARYGSRLMLELGLYYGKGPVFLKDIAKREEISEKYLSQIIIPLKAAGLVESIRGAHGGYVLSRDPKQITMKDIVETLEGSLDLVGCVRRPKMCGRVSLCVTRNLWRKVSDNISQALASVTLEDLVKDYKEVAAQSTLYNI